MIQYSMNYLDKLKKAKILSDPIFAVHVYPERIEKMKRKIITSAMTLALAAGICGSVYAAEKAVELRMRGGYNCSQAVTAVLADQTELSEEYDISRITVRKAIEYLVEEGLLIKKQGIGTFVAEKKLKRNMDVFMGFTRSCELDGKKLLMHDSTYGEIFVPIYGDVPASDLDLSGLTMRNGYAYYEENGEIINDAVYRRNRAVEERLNVKLNITTPNASTTPSILFNEYVLVDRGGYVGDIAL